MEGVKIYKELCEVEVIMEEGEELQELDQTPATVQIDHLASQQSDQMDPGEGPSSYKENSAKEKMLLSIAENFQTQYSFLYPERKPLLLCPVNEYGVPKFVSTTLRRTRLPYPELYDWQGCASFVSDYLSLELLESPTQLPKQLRSPAWVVENRRGTCFEYSTLLCSLLLGAGYDAYCVSGYAVKEMCLLDLSKQECPLLKPQDTVKETPPEKKKPTKYRVKPVRELKSFYELRQKEKLEQKRQALLAQQEEAERLKEEQESRQDPLWGLRVHSWVLVLPGKRDISETFFIDPLSGQSYPTSSKYFLGIESVWNDEHYWVNMQPVGCTDMTFDLQDVHKWESMLFYPRKKPVPKTEEKQEPKDEVTEKHFVMPESWVKEIHISVEDMESRFPGRSKVYHYKKAKLEKFSPYLKKDGLVKRLTTYEDLECTQIKTVMEYYKKREDKLLEREIQKATNVTTERFAPGRSDSLKTHRYTTLGLETERLMEFYSESREDNLLSRFQSPTEMIEMYQDRFDFLYYQQVIYGPEVAQENEDRRPIEKVVVKFHRDRSKPASKDVAEIVFQITRNQIEVTYHLEDDRIVPDFCIFEKFLKPEEFFEKEITVFQVDQYAKPIPQNQLYQTLLSLMEKEEKVLIRIQESVKEVGRILKIRDLEEKEISLKVSTYDMSRNENARLYVEEQKRLAREKQPTKEQEESDLLAPLTGPMSLTKPVEEQIPKDGNLDRKSKGRANITRAQFDKKRLVRGKQPKKKQEKSAQLGAPKRLTKQSEEQIRANCINNFQKRFPKRASVIQARFEKKRCSQGKIGKQEGLDIFASTLGRLGDLTSLSKQSAEQIHSDCMKNLKKSITDRADLIQARLEKESNKLLQKQKWYQEHELKLKKAEKDAYLAYCSEAKFRIDILKMRLSRHTESAPQKFEALDNTLREDPRLKQFLN